MTSRKWALKGVDCGVDGLIAVNSDAGGHAGPTSAEALLDEVGDLGVPVVCAGGVATPDDFANVLRMGYAGAQCGTRFIATEECSASEEYKAAVVDADAEDIVLTERITGVPVAVIDTPWVRAVGTKANWFERWMLRGHRRKHWMRTIYALRSIRKLKKSLTASRGTKTYWQAGRSVEGIREIRPTARIVREFMDAARALQSRGSIPPNQETTSS